MANISVRGLDDAAAKKLSSMAHKKHMSREAYLREQLETLAIAGEIKALENKYENLVRDIADVIMENTNVLEQVMKEMEK